MDATAGLTKNKNVPAPPTMSKVGLTLNRDAARRGLGPARNIDAWTRYQDPIALGDAAVRAKTRFLFTPLAARSLSPAGARAGLGPDGVTGAERTQTDGVDTRPDPRLDRPIASRLADDISESAQMAQAERMGVHVPVEAPTLSRAGAMAGLAPLGPSSSSRKAKAIASSNDLAMSVSKVGMNARKTTAMQSRPVAPISDASGRRGITGKNPIASAGKGFEKKVPMSPRAQDRERWASGTSDRIAAASKGLSLANMNWGDHRGATKPQPKRTWVGKQGDATECPDNCTAVCADLAVRPWAGVNKSAPFRELEKETVPSDVCPPLRSDAGTLEVLIRDDKRVLARSPAQLLAKWQGRALNAGVRGGSQSLRSASFPSSVFAANVAGAMSSSKPGCGCSDCGCGGTKTASTASLIGRAASGVSASARSAQLSGMGSMASKTLPAVTGHFGVSSTLLDQKPPVHVGRAAGASLKTQLSAPPSAYSATPGVAATESEYIEGALLEITVRLAAANPDAEAEEIYLRAAAERSQRKDLPWPPSPLPDPDLARGIVGIAQRLGPGYRSDYVLDQALRSPLFVEPALLDLIVKSSRQRSSANTWLDPGGYPAPWTAWHAAWCERLKTPGPLPTPPDVDLLLALVRRAEDEYSDSKTLLREAQAEVQRYDTTDPPPWPQPRQIPPEGIGWFLWALLKELGDSSHSKDDPPLELLLELTKYSEIPFSARNAAYAQILDQIFLQPLEAIEWAPWGSRDTLNAGDFLGRMQEGDDDILNDPEAQKDGRALRTLLRFARVSKSGNAALIFQDDGNLVLYGSPTGKNMQPLWTAGTGPNRGASRVDMQSDGNFVVYDRNGTAMWASDTYAHRGTYLVVQDDGNLVVYGYGTVSTGGGHATMQFTSLWSTETEGFKPYHDSGFCDVPLIGQGLCLIASPFVNLGNGIADLFHQAKEYVNAGVSGFAQTWLHPSFVPEGDTPGGPFGYFAGAITDGPAFNKDDLENAMSFPVSSEGWVRIVNADGSVEIVWNPALAGAVSSGQLATTGGVQGAKTGLSPGNAYYAELPTYPGSDDTSGSIASSSGGTYPSGGANSEGPPPWGDPSSWYQLESGNWVQTGGGETIWKNVPGQGWQPGYEDPEAFPYPGSGYHPWHPFGPDQGSGTVPVPQDPQPSPQPPGGSDAPPSTQGSQSQPQGPTTIPPGAFVGNIAVGGSVPVSQPGTTGSSSGTQTSAPNVGLQGPAPPASSASASTTANPYGTVWYLNPRSGYFEAGYQDRSGWHNAYGVGGFEMSSKYAKAQQVTKRVLGLPSPPPPTPSWSGSTGSDADLDAAWEESWDGDDPSDDQAAQLGEQAGPNAFLPVPEHRQGREIESIAIDLTAQKITVTYKSGDPETAKISSGRGRSGTLGDPCANEGTNCTPRGTFVVYGLAADRENYRSNKGYSMPWFVLPKETSGTKPPAGQKSVTMRRIGIHGTSKTGLLGTPVSHGCVRVATDLAKRIWMGVVKGTTITIDGKAPTKPWREPGH